MRWQLAAALVLLHLCTTPAACMWSQVAGNGSSTPSLAAVRQALITLEDTIVYNLAERARFGRNPAAYQPGVLKFEGESADMSLLSYILCQREGLEGALGRYSSQEEHAFLPNCVPEPLVPTTKRTLTSTVQVPGGLFVKGGLWPCSARVDVNDDILALYLEQLLPNITAPVDDGSYASAASADIAVLQALSKRIHMGAVVAEAKFQAQPEQYRELILGRNSSAIMTLLTDAAVERQVVERVLRKAAAYAQNMDAAPPGNGTAVSYKVEPDLVAELYEGWVIPLTKEVQVQYLLRRLEEGECLAAGGEELAAAGQP